MHKNSRLLFLSFVIQFFSSRLLLTSEHVQICISCGNVPFWSSGAYLDVFREEHKIKTVRRFTDGAKT